MDVVGNNIANVNTVAYKGSRATFQDVFYQTISGGSAPDESRGGVNPKQVGVGMALNSIDTMFIQGNVEPTGNATDLMIQGDGFFVLVDVMDEDGDRFYTRAGVFCFDAAGNLTNKSDGKLVMGFAGEVDDGGGDSLIPLNWENMDTPVDNISDLNTLTINSRGEIIGNGEVMGTIALVKFPNNEGLEKIGENQFVWSSAAGGGENEGEPPQPSVAGYGESGLGNTVIVSGALEMSNVELAREFTDMIITQRGYQANARTITASDEMLQELVNLKR